MKTGGMRARGRRRRRSGGVDGRVSVCRCGRLVAILSPQLASSCSHALPARVVRVADLAASRLHLVRQLGLLPIATASLLVAILRSRPLLVALCTGSISPHCDLSPSPSRAPLDSTLLRRRHFRHLPASLPPWILTFQAIALFSYTLPSFLILSYAPTRSYSCKFHVLL